VDFTFIGDDEMVSVNLEAKKTVDLMIENADDLNIAVHKLENGSTVIDAGVEVAGSFKAGELYTKVCLGGLAEVGISIPGDLSENFAIPSVKIKTHQPAISTLGSQKAGWSVSVGDFFALGSGPARALALKPEETYEEIGYMDEADLAIITLESDKLPGVDVMDYVAKECKVAPENVYALVAPTSSLVGSIQIAGRVVENGTYKMLEALHFDVNKVKHAAGIAPIAPVDPDGMKAMGKTNDAVLFGGRTYYYIESETKDNLKELAEKLPSSAADGYGKPFYDVFKEANFDFFQIDKGMFAPAEVVINDLTTGELFRGGYVNVELLKKSFGI
jgi:methenyltetrahydromethanopterin cyclohydrolase